MATEQIWKHQKLTGSLLLWMILSFLNPSYGFSQNFQKENSYRETTEARLAVEMAWETYHDGALGGTLTSPSTQIQLEMNLHKSRALLADAYEAEEKGESENLSILINKIFLITNKVITQSQVRKK